MAINVTAYTSYSAIEFEWFEILCLQEDGRYLSLAEFDTENEAEKAIEAICIDGFNGEFILVKNTRTKIKAL